MIGSLLEYGLPFMEMCHNQDCFEHWPPLFSLFPVGQELDINAIHRSSHNAFGIGAAGILLPFLLGIGIIFFHKRIVSSYSLGWHSPQPSLSSPPFLLTTTLRETAMAAAGFNGVATRVLLALALALSGDFGIPIDIALSKRL